MRLKERQSLEGGEVRDTGGKEGGMEGDQEVSLALSMSPLSEEERERERG